MKPTLEDVNHFFFAKASLNCFSRQIFLCLKNPGNIRVSIKFITLILWNLYKFFNKNY